jgi:HAD superfamily hydrolase (TIGR01509 family)
VPRLEACLVDAYDTILTCDFSALTHELPTLAGLPIGTWNEDYRRLSPLLNDGRMSKAAAFAEILRAHGRDPRPELVREMVRLDQELLIANTRLFDDTMPFLNRLRAHGVKVAVVSNCTENTRPMLVSLGVDALADALVLSCEVGAAKPAAQIFRHALGLLGVAAEAAVFVDDQAGFCAGGQAAGIRAVQMVRGDLDGQVPEGAVVARSLTELEAMFPG